MQPGKPELLKAHVEKLGVVVCACSPSTGEAEMCRSQKHTSQSASSNSGALEVPVRDLSRPRVLPPKTGKVPHGYLGQAPHSGWLSGVLAMYRAGCITRF